MPSADEITRHLGLEPLPDEGGLFRRSYLADETLETPALPGRYRSARAHGSAIYYLLTDEPDSFSALHRLLTDEVYHFYLGDPVRLLLLHPDGSHETRTLGPDLLGGHDVQFVVPRGVWQGSHLVDGGAWALLGTTMAPAFDVTDFELGARDALLDAYPERADDIVRLTRPVAAAR